MDARGMTELNQSAPDKVDKPQAKDGSPKEELWNADPDCEHDIRAKTMGEGGGVECTKCKGWFCY